MPFVHFPIIALATNSRSRSFNRALGHSDDPRWPLEAWVTCALRALFNWVSKVILQLLWFCIATLCDWLKYLAPLPRPIVTHSHAFYRAWHGRHVIPSSSDWLIGLFTAVVIGQSNYFGFGFTTLKRKLLYQWDWYQVERSREMSHLRKSIYYLLHIYFKQTKQRKC